MSTKIEQGIKNLKEELIYMGALCERAISIAIRCAIYFDCDEIEKVYEMESETDKLEKSIENNCMELLLQHNPFASDFRMISSALKMISDFERIGDQAQDIAELSKHIVSHNSNVSTLVKEMAKEVIDMLKMTVDAVVNEDLALAKVIIERDDVVDLFFDKVKYDIINLLSENKEEGEVVLDVFLVAKYLERIADHCTNLSEWLVYSITGVHK